MIFAYVSVTITDEISVMFLEHLRSTPIGFTIESVGSLLAATRVWKPSRLRNIYRNFPDCRSLFCAHSDEHLLEEVCQVLDDRGVDLQTICDPAPYWNPAGRYNPWYVYGSMVQFLDDHGAPVPRDQIPPEEHVREYVDFVLSSPGRMSLAKQFEALLDVTDNSVMGAAHVGALASRHMARTSDLRAYPTIVPTEESIVQWRDNLAPFPIFDAHDRCDISGDTYYFWTHVFAGMAYAAIDNWPARLMQKHFEYGTAMMVNIAKSVGRPLRSTRYESSLLGRHIGLALADRDFMGINAWDHDLFD